MVWFYKYNYVCFVLHTVFMLYLVVHGGEEDGRMLSDKIQYGPVCNSAGLQNPKILLNTL